ncbi:LOW QUALITY PROTEIN: hypothetical protein PHMEG_00012536 [Phytophthora megakarya]|uniref:Uncharacterized protein n=1 Tax=Phytophthora megakarya TaxID=4795 RepID=A0A225W8Y2_9STRA|nr:LOW QUALITY PROTEIN: hypothetical protein PHMEG_00012536 [Phytophthora megakarya]
MEPRGNNAQYGELAHLLKKQTEQIDVLILQNKRIQERVLAVEVAKLDTKDDTTGSGTSTSAGFLLVDTDRSSWQQTYPPKGEGTPASLIYLWFTVELRVFCSCAVKKAMLYEFRYISGYLILFIPLGFKLYSSSSVIMNVLKPEASLIEHLRRLFHRSFDYVQSSILQK